MRKGNEQNMKRPTSYHENWRPHVETNQGSPPSTSKAVQGRICRQLMQNLPEKLDAPTKLNKLGVNNPGTTQETSQKKDLPLFWIDPARQLLWPAT